jgi:hypothetical protein
VRRPASLAAARLGLVCLLSAPLAWAAPRDHETAPPGEKVRGITLSTHTDGSDWATGDLCTTLADMRAVGASWVAIHPYARIRADGSVLFRPVDRHALPDYLASPIREAREHGLKLALVPHLAHWGSPFRWRGEIAFADEGDWQRFWETYTSWIVGLASACPEVDGFVVGSELDGTVEHEARWRQLIRQVRARTPAPLTYAANWTDYRRVPFWDALDAIGIQAYFPVADSEGASPASIAARWRDRMAELRGFAARWNRRIVFTELGYNRSLAAPVRPWDPRPDGAEAEPIQEMCLRIALAAVESEPSVAGAFLWKWFPNPRPVGRNFQLATPRLKRAIAAIWVD